MSGFFHRFQEVYNNSEYFLLHINLRYSQLDQKTAKFQDINKHRHAKTRNQITTLLTEFFENLGNEPERSVSISVNGEIKKGSGQEKINDYMHNIFGLVNFLASKKLLTSNALRFLEQNYKFTPQENYISLKNIP